MRAIQYLAGALLLALSTSPALAQVEGVRLGLRYQTEYRPGLVVLPFAAEGAAGRLAQPVGGIIKQDLDFADRFNVLADAAGARPGEQVNLALWKERNADFILDGALRPGAAGGATIRLVLHDAVYGTVKGDQTFLLPPQGDPGFRMAVHAASDEVVRWATGEPGAAASRIAFILESRGTKEVYTIDYDGESMQRVTNDGDLALSPAWSPDGSRLAYTTYRTGSPLIFEHDLRTARDRMVSDRDGSNIGPSYSPDGQTIAFGTTVAGIMQVATVGRDGLRQHTRGQSDSLEPSYSPDGRQFAFVSNRLGEPQVYVMTVGGSGDPRLISDYSYGEKGFNVSPDWSPKGNKIVYASRIGGVRNGVQLYQIILADLADGTRRFLTNEWRNEEPSWAGDGRHIVFASPDREGGGLFVLDTINGRIRFLLRGKGYSAPDWSPVLRRVEPASAR